MRTSYDTAKNEVSKAARTMVALSRPIAAICAATLALAYAGLLNEHLHTSNGKAFTGKYIPEYHGEKLYQASPSVSDRFVITASKWFSSFRLRRRDLPGISP